MKVILLAIISATFLCSCASTELYSNGVRVLKTQADMDGVVYRYGKDGSVSFTAARINHSTPTLAQGKAASDKIGALGAAIGEAGLMTLFK